jgi:hypothetical protein
MDRLGARSHPKGSTQRGVTTAATCRLANLESVRHAGATASDRWFVRNVRHVCDGGRLQPEQPSGHVIIAHRDRGLLEKRPGSPERRRSAGPMAPQCRLPSGWSFDTLRPGRPIMSRSFVRSSLTALGLCTVLVLWTASGLMQRAASVADTSLGALYTEEWNWRQQKMASGGNQSGGAGASERCTTGVRAGDNRWFSCRKSQLKSRGAEDVASSESTAAPLTLAG